MIRHQKGAPGADHSSVAACPHVPLTSCIFLEMRFSYFYPFHKISAVNTYFAAPFLEPLHDLILHSVTVFHEFLQCSFPNHSSGAGFSLGWVPPSQLRAGHGTGEQELFPEQAPYLLFSASAAATRGGNQLYLKQRKTSIRKVIRENFLAIE